MKLPEYPTKKVAGTTVVTEASKRRSRNGIQNHPIEFRPHLPKLACELGISMAGLATEHEGNPNLAFSQNRALRASEYGPVGLLPVPAPVTSAAPADAIEIRRPPRKHRQLAP
ncbi:protein of unknown function [Burkholderia multivorans]